MIGRTILHYKIVKKLGTGGMGDVYLAEDTKLNRQVALKFLPKEQAVDPDARHRFIHEAKAQALISHPNIAAFHDVLEHNGQVFIVMEYVEGRSLSQVLHEDNPSITDSLAYIIQAGEGLQAAHEKGVVHRDVKPANVLVTGKGHVKVLDFGLARWQDATRITKSGTRLGTAAYMSPEQAEGRKVDHRSDIFSLGVMLYELVCARRPFEGDSEPAVLYDILNTEPEPLARYSNEAPEELQRVASKSLAKRTDERYQSTADFVADLKRLKRNMESGVTSDSKVSGEKRTRPKVSYLLTGVITVIVAAVLVITNPFNWKIVQDEGAVAAENSLAVMYFDNLVDPEDADRSADILTSLLTTDLSESEFLAVTSQQRLFDILRQLGQGSPGRIDQSTALDVAKAARVKYIVTGDILRVDPTILITSSISEAGSGRNVSAQRVEGSEGDDIFSVVDKLTEAIREDLSLPAAARSEKTRPVAEVTTTSQDAYRHYLEGLAHVRRFDEIDAAESFRKAVECDSTFAMAHYRLATIGGGGIVSYEQANLHFDRARTYAGNATWREQALIRAAAAGWGSYDDTGSLEILQEIVDRYPDDKEALYDLGSALWMAGLNGEHSYWDRSLEEMERVIELDPYYTPAYDALVYLYGEHANDMEKALWAINQYISLAPDEADPYGTRGDLYLGESRYDEALASWQKALELDPDRLQILQKVGWMYLFRKHEFDEAEQQFRRMASHSEQSIRSEGRLCLAIIHFYRGQFAEGLRVIDDGVAADHLDGATDHLAYKHFCKARALTELGRFPEATEVLSESIDDIKRSVPESPESHRLFRPFEIELLACNGDFAAADAGLEELLAYAAENGDPWMAQYWWAKGSVEELRGNSDLAAAHFDSALTGIHLNWRFLAQYRLGRVLLANGQLGDAANVFESTLRGRIDGSKQRHAFWAAEVHYYLGQVYEQSGWNDRAIEQYETFLDIWSEADPGLAMVDDAKQRLAELKS